MNNLRPPNPFIPGENRGNQINKGAYQFGQFTKKEKSLEERRKALIPNAVRARAVAIAQKIMELKGQVTLKEMDVMIKKERSKCLESYRKLFDEKLHDELQVFLSDYLISK